MKHVEGLNRDQMTLYPEIKPAIGHCNIDDLFGERWFRKNVHALNRFPPLPQLIACYVKKL